MRIRGAAEEIGSDNVFTSEAGMVDVKTMENESTSSSTSCRKGSSCIEDVQACAGFGGDMIMISPSSSESSLSDFVSNPLLILPLIIELVQRFEMI